MADLGVNVSDNIRCDVINSYLLTWRIWGITKRAYILLRRYPCVSSLSHRNGDNPCTRQAVGVLAHPWSSHYGIKHNSEYFDTIIAYIIMQPP